MPTTDATIRITDVDEGSDPLSTPGGVPVALRAYPNPASGSVRFVGLSAARTYSYNVYSLAGQQVAKGGGGAIDMSGLARGQYVLVLQAEDGSETLRAWLAVK